MCQSRRVDEMDLDSWEPGEGGPRPPQPLAARPQIHGQIGKRSPPVSDPRGPTRYEHDVTQNSILPIRSPTRPPSCLLSL